MRIIAIIFLACICYACSPVPGIRTETAYPADSFMVHGFQSGQEVQNLQYIDDSLLISYNPIHNELSYFTQKNAHDYSIHSLKPLSTEAWSSMFLSSNGQPAMIGRSNVLSLYNKTGDSLLFEKNIHHSFPLLGKNFMSISLHDAEAKLFGDTLVIPFAHSSLENYTAALKEDELAEFKMGKDSLRFLKTCFPKPPGLSNYYLPLAKHCWNGQTVHVIYPCYDTIYTYNRSTQSLSKTHIGNRDYTLPDRYENKVFTPGYGSYQTKYELNNFQYQAIHYNPKTRHFILFYVSPVKESFKNRLPTPNDQEQKALVLNEAFEPLAYYVFHNSFVHPCSYFIIPGRGIAMPLFKDHEHFENTLFHIYNF